MNINATVLLEATAAMAVLNLSLEDGWQGRPRDVETSTKEKMAQVKKASERLENMLEDAEDMATAPAPAAAQAGAPAGA